MSPTNLVKVYFDLDAPLAKTVSVIGTFNEWNSGWHPMQKREDDGWWYAEVDMFPDTHKYRFDVDGAVIMDPENPFTVRDINLNGLDSVLDTEKRSPDKRPKRAASTADEYVKVEFIYSNTNARVVFLSGEFNGWATTFKLHSYVGGVWKDFVYLKPGEYGYKFIVNGEWILDPVNKKTMKVDGVINSKVSVQALNKKKLRKN